MLNWLNNFDSAKEKALSDKKPILLQFEMETCGGCKKLYDFTYFDEDVINEMSNRFVLLKLDLMHDRNVRRLFGAYWTPSFYFLDYKGNSFYNVNGYFPPLDLRAHLRLGYAQVNIPKGKWQESIEYIDEKFNDFTGTDLAPKLLMQKGMILLIQKKDNYEFKKLMRLIKNEYPDSPEARMYFWDE